MNPIIADLLAQHSLRKTPMRIAVLDLFIEADHEAITHPELERRFPDADRVTLYRTLKSFEEKGIIHQVIDSSNATKYALCHTTCTTHQHTEDHAHFHCQDCGKTICLDNVSPSPIQIPNGFEVKQTHLVLEGKCSDCP